MCPLLSPSRRMTSLASLSQLHILTWWVTWLPWQQPPDHSVSPTSASITCQHSGVSRHILHLDQRGSGGWTGWCTSSWGMLWPLWSSVDSGTGSSTSLLSNLRCVLCKEIFFLSSDCFLEASQVQDEPSLPEHETDQAWCPGHSLRQLFRSHDRDHPVSLLGCWSPRTGDFTQRCSGLQHCHGSPPHSLQVIH